MMGKTRPLKKRKSNDKRKRKMEKSAVPRKLINFLANY